MIDEVLGPSPQGLSVQLVLGDEWRTLVIGYAANKTTGSTADLSIVAETLRASGRFAEPVTASFSWSQPDVMRESAGNQCGVEYVYLLTATP